VGKPKSSSPSDLILALVNYTWCFTCQLFWNFASKNFSALLWKQTCISLHQSAKACPPLSGKWRRKPKLSSACSSLSEETLKFFWTGFYLKTNCSVMKHCTYQWAATSCKMCLHAIIISCCHGDDIFCLSTNQNFPFFEETGNSLLSKISTAPLFVSILTPHPVKSSFCTGVQFSCDPIHRFNNRK